MDVIRVIIGRHCHNLRYTVYSLSNLCNLSPMHRTNTKELVHKRINFYRYGGGQKIHAKWRNHQCFAIQAKYLDKGHHYSWEFLISHKDIFLTKFFYFSAFFFCKIWIHSYMDWHSPQNLGKRAYESYPHPSIFDSQHASTGITTSPDAKKKLVLIKCLT